MQYYLKFALCSWSHSHNNPCLSLLVIYCYAKEVGTLLLYLQWNKKQVLGMYLKSVAIWSRNLVGTFPLTDVPIGSGLTVTVPFKASSRTLAEIVVLIGTPNLLWKIEWRFKNSLMALNAPCTTTTIFTWIMPQTLYWLFPDLTSLSPYPCLQHQLPEKIYNWISTNQDASTWKGKSMYMGNKKEKTNIIGKKELPTCMHDKDNIAEILWESDCKNGISTCHGKYNGDG